MIILFYMSVALPINSLTGWWNRSVSWPNRKTCCPTLSMVPSLRCPAPEEAEPRFPLLLSSTLDWLVHTSGVGAGGLKAMIYFYFFSKNISAALSETLYRCDSVRGTRGTLGPCCKQVNWQTDKTTTRTTKCSLVKKRKEKTEKCSSKQEFPDH